MRTLIFAAIVLAAPGCAPHAQAPSAKGAPAPVPPMNLAMIRDTAGTIVVPEGAFTMGCDAATDAMCEPDERPAHSIALPAYRIDATEVTQAAYRACIDAGACTAPYHGPTPWEGDACVHRFDAAEHPRRAVTCVSWAQATGFCAWAGKRLPSESEWEKAARGADHRTFPWGDDPPSCERASIAGCTDEDVARHPLGRSPYGAYDMAGGVWEWTADWYAASAYSDVRSDAGGPASGEFRAVRGCEFNASHGGSRDYRAANRFALAPAHVSVRLGFRCAR